MNKSRGYYIVIFTSEDYYIIYEGFKIVKANNEATAMTKAIKLLGYDEGILPSYMSVEAVIFCLSVRL